LGQPTQYRTNDLYFAAYLKVAQVPFVGTERKGAQVSFVFEHQGSSMMRNLKDQYFSDRAKVPALSFVQALKYFKGMLFPGPGE